MAKIIRVDDSVAYVIYRVSRLLRKHFVALASEHNIDLTPEQWFILNKLRLGDGQSQAELCEALGDRPNMTRILATMAGKGLVVRGQDPVDGRKSRVYLTRAGRQIHDGFARVVDQDRSKIFRGLSEAEIQQTMRVLALLEHNMLQ